MKGRAGVASAFTLALPLAATICVGCDSGQQRVTDNRATTGSSEPLHPAGIPTDFVVVGPSGGRVFATLPSFPRRQANRRQTSVLPPPAVDRTSQARVEPGFGFVVTHERVSDGVPYVHLSDGRWLPSADVIRVKASGFAGVTLHARDGLRVGWVIVPEATIRVGPRLSTAEITTRSFHTPLTFTGPCQAGWCPLTAVGWVRAVDVAIPTLDNLPPRDATTGAATTTPQRWLDVDLASQTLVAYDGQRPVYATLISGGIGQPGSPFATPTGVFRIRSKHALARMDNLEHTGVVPYAYDVPLTQYFSDGKALHAALWHDRFGRRSSHGCINLSPRDAAWLYQFTDPPISAGATDAYATANRPGTVVRIRGGS